MNKPESPSWLPMQLPQESKITPQYSALEHNLEELEDRGFIRIQRGPGSDSIIGIEVIPVVTIEASSSTSTGTSSWDKQGEALLGAFCNINEELYFLFLFLLLDVV